ncbi:MAG: response regulator transcription factor [Pyrinomonadaceae bacterium]
MTHIPQKPPIRPRVIIADDNKAIRDIVVQLLGLGFEIVGVADNGNEIIDLAKRLRPDIGVFDISMPGKSGIEAAEEIRTLDLDMRIVFLTVHEDPEFVRRAMEIGASGYVAKRKLAKELTVALKEVRLGQTFISPCCSSPEYQY